MNHTEFFTALGNGKIEKCYLFEGTEEFTKRAALNALRKQVTAGEFAAMNDVRLQDPPPDELIAAVETLPFLSERRFVEVRECALLTGEKPKEYDEEKAVLRYQDYFMDLPETTCLVFYVRGKADGRKKMYNLLKKRATLVSFEPLKDRELTQWIAQRLGSMGKQINHACCQQLWFSAGRELTMLANELEKLAAYMGERTEVTPADIDAVCVKSVEYKVFDLSDALFSGRGSKALAMLDALLSDGEDRLMILSVLGRQCRQLLYTSAMMAAGKRLSQIATELGVPDFVASKNMNMAKRYSTAQLRRLTRLCTETEYLVKSGQLMEQGAVEKVMLQIMGLGKEHT